MIYPYYYCYRNSSPQVGKLIQVVLVKKLWSVWDLFYTCCRSRSLNIYTCFIRLFLLSYFNLNLISFKRTQYYVTLFLVKSLLFLKNKKKQRVQVNIFSVSLKCYITEQISRWVSTMMSDFTSLPWEHTGWCRQAFPTTSGSHCVLTPLRNSSPSVLYV